MSGTSTGYGTGGALTRLAAARYAAEGGVVVILTATELVESLAEGNPHHTWFGPFNEAAS